MIPARIVLIMPLPSSRCPLPVLVHVTKYAAQQMPPPWTMMPPRCVNVSRVERDVSLHSRDACHGPFRSLVLVYGTPAARHTQRVYGGVCLGSNAELRRLTLKSHTGSHAGDAVRVAQQLT